MGLLVGVLVRSCALVKELFRVVAVDFTYRCRSFLMSGTLVFDNSHLKQFFEHRCCRYSEEPDRQRPCAHGAHSHVEKMERGQIIILIMIS